MRQTVKFRRSEEPLSPLTSQDRTIASLKTLIADLNVQIAALAARVTNLSEKAQSSVKAKNRVAALAALKSKKAAENVLSQRYESLEQVEGVYTKIEQAADQVALVRVMEASTGVLRNLHTQIGGVERVEDVVEGLRDEMSKADEIGHVMQEAGRGEDIVDEDAIEEELEALEKKDRAEKEEQEAERTRRRLAELDASKQQDALPSSAKEPSEDSAVASGTKGVRRLSLETPLSKEAAKLADKPLTADS